MTMMLAVRYIALNCMSEPDLALSVIITDRLDLIIVQCVMFAS